MIATDVFLSVSIASAVTALVLFFFTDFEKKGKPGKKKIALRAGPWQAGLVLEL
jgi:hypothetical protein